MKRTSLNDPCIRKIKQAGAWLYRECRFLGALAIAFDGCYEESNDPKCTFLATDGATLYYNKKRLLAEPVDIVAGVIAHEVGHCQGGHFARQGERDPGKWNVACDHAVNHLLKKAGLHLPETALCGQKYDGWSAERIYIDLPDGQENYDPGKAAADGLVIDAQSDAPQPEGDTPDQQQQPSAATPQPGEGDGNEGQGDDEQQQHKAEKRKNAQEQTARELAKKWRDRTAEAQITSIAAGTMPADLDRILDAARDPARDWRSVLEHLATDPCKADRRFSPPNRRHIWNGLILPSARGSEVSTLALFIDTSGSIYGPLLSEFIGKGRDMLDSGIIGELIIIACDSRAHLMGRYMRGDDIPLTTLPGGGGTDFRPPFDMLAELDINPTAAAYLTDLAGTFPEEAPPYPVLWLTIEPGTAPFGTTLEA